MQTSIYTTLWKKIFFFFFFSVQILQSSKIIGQTIICGTASSGIKPNTSVNKSIMWVNIYYHVVRSSNHTGGFDSIYGNGNLCSLTNTLNATYNQYGIYFNNLGFDYIDNDTYYSLNQTTNLFGQTIKPDNANAINIYLINSYTGTANYGGCAKSIIGKAFWVINSQALNNTSPVLNTTPHEIGHCLGLFHTFSGSTYYYGCSETGTCQEYVNETNCSTCGDFICDTPADPGTCVNVNSSCQYTGSQTDPNGQVFRPDPNNIMSYANCRTIFSPMQTYAMKNTITNNVSGLLSVKNTTLTIPTIIGVNDVCSSSTYSVSNIPSGYYVSNWSSSNTAIATINSSGVVSKVLNGTATIMATLSNGCQYYYVYLPINVGTGTIGGTYNYGGNTYNITGSTGISVSNTSNVININVANSNDPNTTYSWTVNSKTGTSTYSFTGNKAQLNLAGGASLNITATITTPCGSSSVSFSCYNYSASFAAYPNPANQSLTVAAVRQTTITSSTLTTSATSNFVDSINPNTDIDTEAQNIKVQLFDKNSNVILDSKILNGQVILNTSKVPNGTYYLHVGEGNDMVSKQIIIQH